MNEAKRITERLGGRWWRGGGGYGVAFCPAHDNRRTPALSIRNGDRAPIFKCFAGCGSRDIARAVEALCGGGAHTRPTPPRRPDNPDATARARRIWRESHPADNTLAERYLRQRGLNASLPAALRFHPSCWHVPVSAAHPAMIGKITVGEEDQLVAVHRTFLAADGVKAAVEPNKMMLGPAAGGAVRLSKGGGPLIVCEGVETGLALVQIAATDEPTVWAALSTSGVAGLRLPSKSEADELVIAPDGDAAGRRAAAKLAARADAAGWRVRILPAPGEGLDWADSAVRRATA